MYRVRVPATSANLGPGFDSLGMAFDIYNEYEFSFQEDGIIFEGVSEEFKNKDNIILLSMEKVFKKYSFTYKGLGIKIIEQRVPVSRGLGSSSNCIVAGLIGAFLLMGKKIDKNEIFNLAVEIEGHPDNVGPAIFGGLVVSVVENGKSFYNKVDIKSGLDFIALIPRFRLSTKDARSVLPDKLTYKDSIYNIGRAAMLISCFTNGKYDLLGIATKDRLHENYRSELIDGYDLIKKEAFKLEAIACFISGAGPTVMAITKEDNFSFINKMNNYIKANDLQWDALRLTVDKQGASFYKVVKSE